MPASKDVARQAGVSQTTVSCVPNTPHKVRPQTRQKVLAAIAALHDIPDANARTLLCKPGKVMACHARENPERLPGKALSCPETISIASQHQFFIMKREKTGKFLHNKRFKMRKFTTLKTGKTGLLAMTCSVG